ncbi:MAG: hypothetical protein U0892_13345, partial [Pirellulales bacterium]
MTLKCSNRSLRFLAEEGSKADALARMERLLVGTTKDRFRKVELQVKSAQLKAALGRAEESVSDFETILAQVNPDSWIYQDVRARIDQIFIQRRDYDGLSKYYLSWCESHPDDLDAMLRIGRLMSIQRRSQEAKDWFRKAIERSPTNASPRLALIDALERDELIADAAKAMEELVAVKPEEQDLIIRWGKLVAADTQQPKNEREKRAAEIWMRLSSKRENDPVIVSQVDLRVQCRSDGECVRLCRRAIELAPNDSQYREYLGEYLVGLGRKDEALTALREMAAGSRENRDNLVRLCEVLQSLHFHDEALEAIEKACTLMPALTHRLRYAKLLSEHAKFDPAMAQLDLAAKMAEDESEKLRVVEERVKVLQASNQLATEIERLGTTLKDAASDSEDVTAKNTRRAAWETLARYLDADGRSDEAADAVAKALELNPDSLSALQLAFRVRERAGYYAEAIEALRKLIIVDRRYQSNYLTEIARLEIRLGHVDRAIAAGEELIGTRGVGSEQLRTFANLCFQAGENTRGVDVLRRIVRTDPKDRETLGLLAKRMADDFRTDEAIEWLWKSFEVATELSDKRRDVEQLAELYSRSNRTQQLLDRLDLAGSEVNRKRETELLKASALQSLGDYAAARQVLRPLVAAGSRDVDLLTTLVKLSVAEYDWESAIEYQKKLNEISPSREGTSQLVTFLMETGETADVRKAVTEAVGKAQEFSVLIALLNRMLGNGEVEQAKLLADDWFKQQPDNWEVIVQVMAVRFRLNQVDEGRRLAEKIRGLSIPLQTKSAAGEAAAEQWLNQSTSTSGSPSPTMNSVMSPSAGMSTSAFSGGASAAFSLGSPNTASYGSDPFSRLSQLNRFQRNVSVLQVVTARNRSGFQQTSIPEILSFEDAWSLAEYVSRGVNQSRNRALDGSDGTPFEAEKKWMRDALAENDRRSLWTLVGWLRMQSNFSFTRSSNGQFVQITNADLPSVYTALDRLSELHEPEVDWIRFFCRFNERQRNATGFANQVAMLPLEPLAREELDQLLKLYETPSALKSSLATPDLGLWLSGECKSAGRTADVQRLTDSLFSAFEKQMSPAAYLQLWELDSKRTRDVLTKQLCDGIRKQKSVANVNQSLAIQRFPILMKMISEPDAAVSIPDLISQLKAAQADFAATLSPAQRNEYDLNQSSVLSRLGTMQTIMTANGPVQVQVGVPQSSAVANNIFPGVSAFQSAEMMAVISVVKLNGSAAVREAVSSSLRADVAAVDAKKVIQSTVDHMCRATWLWTTGVKTGAIEEIQKISKTGVADELVAYLECRMLADAGRVDEAMDRLVKLNPSSTQLSVQRDMAIIELAVQLKRRALAQEAAKRLAGARLSPSMRSAAVTMLRELSLTKAVVELNWQAPKPPPNDLAGLLNLMQSHKKNGETARADEVARQILRRTKPIPVINAARSGMYSNGSSIMNLPSSANRRMGDDQVRQPALLHLVESGEAKSMIAALESKLQSNPNSVGNLRQLEELYAATGEGRKALEIHNKVDALIPRSPEELIAEAQQLAKEQPELAVKKYLEAVDKRPEYLVQYWSMIASLLVTTQAWDAVADQTLEVQAKGAIRPESLTRMIELYVQNNHMKQARRLLVAQIKAGGIAELCRIRVQVPRVPTIKPDGLVTTLFDDELRQVLLESLSQTIQNDQAPLQFFNRYDTIRKNNQTFAILSNVHALKKIFKDRESDLTPLAAKIRQRAESDPKWVSLLDCFQLITSDEQLNGTVEQCIEQARANDVSLPQGLTVLADLLLHEADRPLDARKLIEPLVNRPSDGQRRGGANLQLLFACLVKFNELDNGRDLLLNTWLHDSSMLPSSRMRGSFSNQMTFTTASQLNAIQKESDALAVLLAESKWEMLGINEDEILMSRISGLSLGPIPIEASNSVPGPYAEVIKSFSVSDLEMLVERLAKSPDFKSINELRLDLTDVLKPVRSSDRMPTTDRTTLFLKLLQNARQNDPSGKLTEVMGRWRGLDFASQSIVSCAAMLQAANALGDSELSSRVSDAVLLKIGEKRDWQVPDPPRTISGLGAVQVEEFDLKFMQYKVKQSQIDCLWIVIDALQKLPGRHEDVMLVANVISRFGIKATRES